MLIKYLREEAKCHDLEVPCGCDFPWSRQDLLAAAVDEIERLTALVRDFSKQADLDALEISRLIVESNSTSHNEEPTDG